MSKRETLPPRGERVAQRRERCAKIFEILLEEYPEAHCALTYSTPWQLLVATILSAQCTDERVNMVTPRLFTAFPDAATTARADIEEIEAIIHSTGFFRQKSKNIVAAAQRVMDHFSGIMPEMVEEIVTLPGAARKTANVVVANCFPENVSGIAVDTHVQRIARRLGLTREFEPVRVERELMRTIDRSLWGHSTHLLIDHGRAICRASRPLCGDCALVGHCPSAFRFAT